MGEIRNNPPPWGTPTTGGSADVHFLTQETKPDNMGSMKIGYLFSYIDPSWLPLYMEALLFYTYFYVPLQLSFYPISL